MYQVTIWSAEELFQASQTIVKNLISTTTSAMSPIFWRIPLVPTVIKLWCFASQVSIEIIAKGWPPWAHSILRILCWALNLYPLFPVGIIALKMFLLLDHYHRKCSSLSLTQLLSRFTEIFYGSPWWGIWLSLWHLCAARRRAGSIYCWSICALLIWYSPHFWCSIFW